MVIFLKETELNFSIITLMRDNAIKLVEIMVSEYFTGNYLKRFFFFLLKILVLENEQH